MVHRTFRITGAGLALLALSLLAPASRAEDGRVVFTAPRSMATALGPTDVELDVAAPAGLSIERVRLGVDGKPLAELSAPPWRASWDAGDGTRGHLIEALAIWSDGTSTRAVLHTSPLRINQVEDVDLVDVYPLVRDRRGDYVVDLTRDDFEILENGVPQRIARFATQHKPLRMALVLDTSLTMSREGRLDSARKAALSFLDVLTQGDEGLVVTFADDVEVRQDSTTDREALVEAIRNTEAGGGTALYDAVWRTSRMLEAFDGRRVLVLLSDGRDEAANGFEPGSLHTLDEAVEQALRSEVMVFSIGLGRDLDRLLDFDRRFTLEEILRRLSESTGGRTLLSPRAAQLRHAFRNIGEDLRHQYAMSYVSSDPGGAGEWREIEIRVPGRDDLAIVAREGYFAKDTTASGGGDGAR